jgi:hypothetical protein
VTVAQLRQRFLPRLQETAAAIEHDLVTARN